MHSYRERLLNCTKQIEGSSFNCLLVSSKPNLRYLLGVELDTGERLTALLLNPNESPKLFIHEMFREKLKLDDLGIEIIPYVDSVSPVDLLFSNFKHSVGVDKDLPSHFFIKLMKAYGELEFHTNYIVEKMREKKEPSEVRAIRKSSRIADAVMHQITQLQIFPATEKDLAKNIEDFFGEHGVDELAFKPIIGFGENSASPHHSISNKNSSLNQPILIDMGGVYEGYYSDITRMNYFGSKNSEFEEVYKIVQDVQKQAIEMVKPGIRFSEIDCFIRKELNKWNYEKYFIHRTGHGIGLELHEGPFIHENNLDTVEEGMIFTIEPGVYIPNKFGVRIEDTIVVHEEGCECLNLSSKELQYLNLLTI